VTQKQHWNHMRMTSSFVIFIFNLIGKLMSFTSSSV